MNIKFNEKKTTEAAARLLHLRGGRMSYMKLIKLLYLVDREALIRLGRPVSYDKYVSMDNGPVLSYTYNLICEGSEPGSQSYWSEYIAAPKDFEVALLKEPSYDGLSSSEAALIDEVYKKYGAYGRWDLVKMTHDLPEWVDPSGSAIPIEYSDILLHSGRTPSERVAILQDLDHVTSVKSLLDE